MSLLARQRRNASRREFEGCRTPSKVDHLLSLLAGSPGGRDVAVYGAEGYAYNLLVLIVTHRRHRRVHLFRPHLVPHLPLPLPLLRTAR